MAAEPVGEQPTLGRGTRRFVPRGRVAFPTAWCAVRLMLSRMKLGILTGTAAAASAMNTPGERAQHDGAESDTRQEKRESATNPRARGTNPRARGTNPRARGTNRRAVGTNPRALGSNPRAQGTNPRTAKGKSPKR